MKKLTYLIIIQGFLYNFIFSQSISDINRLKKQHKDIINQINQWKRKLIVDDYLERIQTSFISDKIEKNNQLYELLDKKLDSLRSIHNISINLELLSDVDVIDDVKGHIPELQLFKLGLPYLRKAYPTPNLMFIYVN